jgi:hypothetical protein
MSGYAAVFNRYGRKAAKLLAPHYTALSVLWLGPGWLAVCTRRDPSFSTSTHRPTGASKHPSASLGWRRGNCSRVIKP